MFNRQSLHIALLLWGVIFSLIAALCMFMSKNFDKEKRKWLLGIQLVCAVLLLSDAFAWGFRGSVGLNGYVAVRISNFLVFALSNVILVLYHGYLCCCLFHDSKRKPRIRICFVYGIAAFGVVMVILSQFTNLYYYFDAHNFYHRSPAHMLSMVIPMCGMILDLSLMIQYRKKVSRQMLVSLASYMTLPFIMSVVQIFYYGISLTNIAISISMIVMFVVAMIEQNQNLARKEQEAADMRIEVMLSQIAPHFIYNTLSSVQQLCRKKPVEAEETIGQFADYLRGNLDSLSEKKPVPFERELKHVRCYLAIEKRRFGDRVNVEYDIEDEDFLIPALALQPLVENAVKHGLCKKEDGGTVWISTQRKPGAVYVVIKDDGIGFDQQRVGEADKVHIGLANVAKRIENLCGGTLSVDSAVGKGTMVMITLPQAMEE